MDCNEEDEEEDEEDIAVEEEKEVTGRRGLEGEERRENCWHRSSDSSSCNLCLVLFFFAIGVFVGDVYTE